MLRFNILDEERTVTLEIPFNLVSKIYKFLVIY